jgi:tetratricopeptide (TPR) repeat protein
MLVLLLTAGCRFGSAQTPSNGDYQLALTDHKGQLSWSIDGFKVTQNSAKPGGLEIGVRAADSSRRLSFLGFLFLVPEDPLLTSAKCRDGALAQVKQSNLKLSEILRPGGLPVALATYTTTARDGSPNYSVRGFVATGDICGDLEFYSGSPISDDDADLKKALHSFALDPGYTPRFADVTVYAEVLYKSQAYKAAAPIFEKALAMVPDDGAPYKSAKIARRITRDQAGMSYGITGDLAKSRAIFEKGIVEDPEYPMYYYNLACAEAGEKKLPEARVRLKQAFDRKANVNPGESMPDPLNDDSFLPYQSDKSFWQFLEGLQAKK